MSLLKETIYRCQKFILCLILRPINRKPDAVAAWTGQLKFDLGYHCDTIDSA